MENEDRIREIHHVKQALKMNNYPEWMLTILHPKSTTEDTEEPQNEKKIYASMPYIKGILERLQRAFKSHEVTLIHKPVNSLRSQLVHVKDTTNLKKCGTVYQIHCEKCNKEYVGETARSLEIRNQTYATGVKQRQWLWISSYLWHNSNPQEALKPFFKIHLFNIHIF